MKWFRWYRGASENPKFAMIAEVADDSDTDGLIGPGGEGNRLHGAVTVTDVISVYITVLEDAARVTHFGICTKDENFIACVLRWWPPEVRLVLDTMVKFDLLEKLDNGHYRVNKWDEYQYVSDSDPTNSERQKRYRNRHKTDGSRPHNAPVTRLDTDTDTDKKDTSLRSEIVSCETTERYEFESGVIRLSSEDFKKWKGSFSFLDLKAELLSLTPWANEQGEKWFFAVSAALAKRNREQKIKLETAKGSNPSGRHGQNDPLAGII